MFAISIILSIIALVASPVLGHIEVIDPYPILSPANPAVHWADKNYDMMAPLLWDGLPYPCKGYLWSTPEKERVTQKTWSAGSWQSITLGPNGAPHKGGSCQISMSYDYGRTWQVILSIMGGCPTDGYKMDFQIPSEAPSGHTVFSWSWFNHEGNREMYMNCFIIDIINGGTGLPTRDYPPPFVANANVNGCSTIEGVDPIFPNPGKNVRWGGPYRGQQIWEQRGIRGTNCVDWNAHEMPAGAMGRTGYEPPPAPSSSSTSTTTAITSTTTSSSSSSSSSTVSTEAVTTASASSSTSSTATASTSAIGTDLIASPPPSSTPSSTTTAASSLTTSATDASSTTSTSTPTSTAVTSSPTSATVEASPSPSTTPSGGSSSMVTFDPSTTSAAPEPSSSPASSSTTLPTTAVSSTSSAASSSTELLSSPSATISTTTSAAITASALPTTTPRNPTCKRVIKRSFAGLHGQGGKERVVRRVVRQVKTMQVVQGM